MPDSKITALTSISTSTDPANDPLVIVDVSDTSMAATGTTKKVTLNQLLGASGTATLASATITGDLTVDTNVLKVDSANNRVGINTASPSVPLHILNTTAATNTAVDVLLISQTSTGTPASGLGGGLLFRSQRPSGGLILNRGAIYGVSGVDPDDDGDLAFYTLTNTGPTGFTEKYRLDSNGVATWSNVGGVAGTAMTLNANGLGIGVTPSAGGGCLQLKSGITFPATQVASSDANTLDDYEEGTWTATLKGSVSDPTTPVTATGRYTKIGRQVSIQLFVNNVTTTGASGRIQIDGLPFANNGSVEAISNVGFYNMATFTGVPFGLTSVSSTVVDMWSSVSAGVFQAVNYNTGSVQYVWVNLTYTV